MQPGRVRVLGVDPGLTRCGVGVVESLPATPGFVGLWKVGGRFVNVQEVVLQGFTSVSACLALVGILSYPSILFCKCLPRRRSPPPVFFHPFAWFA